MSSRIVKGQKLFFASHLCEVEKGRQAYVVLPLVEESDKEGVAHLRDAVSTAESLRMGI